MPKTTKRRKPIKATHYAKGHFERLGYRVGLVERTLFPPDGRPAIRFDLFGFGDMVAFKPGSPMVHILQVTSKAHVSDRRAKILANKTARDWMESGHAIAVVGVARAKVRGGKTVVRVFDIKLSEFEIRELSMDDFAEPTQPCA